MNQRILRNAGVLFILIGTPFTAKAEYDGFQCAILATNGHAYVGKPRQYRTPAENSVYEICKKIAGKKSCEFTVYNEKCWIVEWNTGKNSVNAGGPYDFNALPVLGSK